MTDIPVYTPDLSGNETKYVLDCLESNWISSIGPNIEAFETRCAEFIGIRNAVSVSNGTVALHLALHCLDIGPGDEVIVPTFTYIASVNTIAQTGATPVFVECRLDNWLMDPQHVESAITSRTKAIVAVHLYGIMCDMISLKKLADTHGVAIVEDCAEAMGSTLNNRHAGTFGHIGTFSFFGNKTITTGEGGLVITSDDKLAARLRKVKGQGQSADQRYWHDELGFNYRMTNICAAIGVGQMERIDSILDRKRKIAALYREFLDGTDVTFQRRQANQVSSEWLVSMLVPVNVDRDALMRFLLDNGIDSRPVFYCAHQMPMYNRGEHYPISEEIARRGISLPSYPTLNDEDIHRVTASMRAFLAAGGRNAQ